MLALRLGRILVLSVILFAGFAVFHPPTPQASTYPTALENFSAPTAFSETGCLWGLICSGGPHGHCAINGNPDIGCLSTSNNNDCRFSCAM